MQAADAFLRACWLDVAVRKPGNVSVASAGHGMDAAMFVASARAAAGPLCRRGAPVGQRIEAAVAASRAAAGCNTNLGILLLCAPLAAAAERLPPSPRLPCAASLRMELRMALEDLLSALDVADAAAAYRAIAQANPGGLGSADAQDVQQQPTVGLRAAMALAAGRDSVARQYRDGFADLFTLALPSLPPGFSLDAVTSGSVPTAAQRAAVQRLYLLLLRTFLDSHIVRKHGAALAQNVMSQAQGFAQHLPAAGPPDTDPAFAAWDAALKAQALNPGTTADLTVATLFIAGLCAPG